MKQESNILKIIQLSLSKLRTVTTFRNNTAQAWVGIPVARNATKITLAEYRPLHAGLCKGSSDLIGWTVVEVTPEMVGTKLAVFTAIEVKSATGKVRPEQLIFIEQVNKAGGFAGIARGPVEAVNIVNRK
jgi:hypothetical protein